MQCGCFIRSNWAVMAERRLTGNCSETRMCQSRLQVTSAVPPRVTGEKDVWGVRREACSLEAGGHVVVERVVWSGKGGDARWEAPQILF
jgi:hypothetical protein